MERVLRVETPSINNKKKGKENGDFECSNGHRRQPVGCGRIRLVYCQKRQEVG